MTQKIGKLTEVDVRELWKHEQYELMNRIIDVAVKVRDVFSSYIR